MNPGLLSLEAQRYHSRSFGGKELHVNLQSGHSLVRSTLIVSYMLVTYSPPSAFADPSSSRALELLASFTEEPTVQYESAFRYSDKSRIVGLDIHAVGMENTTARYSGQEGAWREVNNILRIKTADGFEGVSGVDTYYQGPHSDEHLKELQSAAAELVAARSLDPVEIRSHLIMARPDLSDTVRASIDIALWDLAARKINRPLYELLGTKRDSIEVYASLPFYETLPEYVEAVQEYAELGFTMFKYHVWGQIELDLALVVLTQQTFRDTPFLFMIDLENVYEIDDAFRLGKQMDEGQFTLLEGPVDDALLAQYAELRSNLGIQIIPAGYTYYSVEYMSRAIGFGAWDAGRFDATVVGGISPALELLRITNEAGLPVEIQSWGHSLAQAANLHLMLANERTPYFEAPMPKNAFEFGMKNGILLDKGKIIAPDGPGLGIKVDWESLAAADFYASVRLEF